MQGNPARKVWEKHLAECLKVAGDCFPKCVWRRNTAKRFVGPADNPGVKEHPERRMLWQRIINSYIQHGRMWGAYCFYAVEDYSKDLFQIKCCAVNWKCVALPVCFFFPLWERARPLKIGIIGYGCYCLELYDEGLLTWRKSVHCRILSGTKLASLKTCWDITLFLLFL